MPKKSLFVYNIECLSLPQMGNKYERYIVLFCVDSTGKTFVVSIDNDAYKPFILLQQNKPSDAQKVEQDTSIDDLQEFLDALNRDLCFGKGELTVSEQYMTPLVGFTDNRKDRILKVVYRGLTNGWRLRTHFNKFGMALDPDLTQSTLDRRNKWKNSNKHQKSSQVDDSMEEENFNHINTKCQLLHESVKDVNLFLHQTKLRLQSWISVEFEELDVSKTIVHADGFIENVCPYYGIETCTEDQVRESNLPAQPPLVLCFLRVVGTSSTANATNVFNADPAIPQDTIRYLAIEIVHTNVSSRSRSLCISLENDYKDFPLCTKLEREGQVLKDVKRFLEEENPHVLVQCSDLHDDIAFLFRRTRHHDNMNIGLSMVKNLPVREVIFMNKLFDITHHGRMRLDIRHALIKFYVSPPMDGFTLIDAHSHTTLIKNKTPLPDSSITNPLSTEEEVKTRVLQEMKVLVALTIDNNFLGNNLALSRSCDMALTGIIERGQQKRVRNVFDNRYYDENIYINHQQLDEPFVVVKRSRSLSSYPDPPWLENPPLESLRSPSSSSFSVPSSKTKKKRKHVSIADLLGKSGYSKPTKKSKTSTKRYTGGFVVPPEPLLYKLPEHAIALLDFASLYPAVIEGSVICFMRVLYDKSWLNKLPESSFEYIPMDDEHCAVYVLCGSDGKPVRSITDKITSEVVKNRKNIRVAMKTLSKKLVNTTEEEADRIKFTLVSMDAAQLSAKVLQNALYGFLGSDTSGMLCTALAAAVTCISAVQNKKMRFFVINEMKARVVYGDTDSVMVQFPTDPLVHISRDQILCEIARQALDAENKSMEMFPYPNKVEFESLKHPMLLTSKKKTYGAIEYGPEQMGWAPQGAGNLLCKGFVFKKRSTCEAVQTTGKTAFELLLKDDEKGVAETVQICADSIQPNPQNIDRYIITCLLNDQYKSKDVIALRLANMIEEDTGVRPLPGRRLPFIIAFFDDNRLHCSRAVTPDRFTKDGMTLDTSYYLKTQLYGAFKQLLDLHPVLLKQIEAIIDRRASYIENIRTGQRTII